MNEDLAVSLSTLDKIGIAKAISALEDALRRKDAIITAMRLVISRTMVDIPQDNVAAFMNMSDQPVRPFPTVPPKDEVRLRLRLVAEEFFELLEATMDMEDDITVSELDGAHASVKTLIDSAPLDVSLSDVADALADLRYVIHGTDHSFGIDGHKVDVLVHKANMEKRNGGKDANGKWRKPLGWTPPDVEGEVRRQIQQGKEIEEAAGEAVEA